MKKLLQICLITVMSLTVSLVAAQPLHAPKKVVSETTQFSVKIDNPQTETRIVKSLSNDKGVLNVSVDAKRDIVTVRYDKALLNDMKLIKEFEKIHVKAKVIKPEPQPQKRQGL